MPTSQTSRDKYHGCIKLIPPPEHRWRDIAMDFVGELAESRGYNAIFVVMDRLSKMRHLVPCRTTSSALDVADMFIWNVFKLHGLPKTIISDRGTQLVAEFWKHCCKRLQMRAKLSTAYHPETDGQTERFNAVVEQYLRCYVSYRQDDWATWLPVAEFSANNHDSSPNSISPFAANYGFNSRFTIAPPVTTDRSTPNSRAQLEVAINFVDTMAQIDAYLHKELTAAQHYYEEQANTQREAAPAYKPGDEVFLLSTNIRSERRSKKLDWKKLGRFKIVKAINPYAYLLDLPASMKISPVVHIHLLRPAGTDPVPGQSSVPLHQLWWVTRSSGKSKV